MRCLYCIISWQRLRRRGFLALGIVFFAVGHPATANEAATSSATISPAAISPAAISPAAISPATFRSSAPVSAAAVSSAPIQDLADDLEPIRAKHQMVALGAAVILDGRLQALGVTGERKAGSGVKVAPGDQFHLGSCTKAMTAVLVAMLVEQGKLRWETTLAEAFPELAGEMQPAFRTVTVKELLQHRAGLTHSWPKDKSSKDMWDLPGAPRQQRAAFAKMILSRPPEITPGTKYSYSNAGYSILGAIAERITDMAWEELIRRRLFEPLKMTTAGFGAMGTKGKIEQPWQHTIGGIRLSGVFDNRGPNPIEPGPRSDNPPVIGPGGIVHCSLADWAKFIEAVLEGARGEANPLLKPATFQVLLRPEFGGDYAGGWNRTNRSWGGGEVLTHNGTNTMNYAVAWLAPKRNFAVLVVTNQGGDAAPKACDEAASAMIRKFLRRQ